ncbi:MAG: hypothetical protein KDB77_00915 [Flavobacteriales bacterium]|nr:hypothetical protein [Flavobacteriales bacterium]HPJ51873.1 hypothetical protein [Flavobacteriales bacterium]
MIKQFITRAALLVALVSITNAASAQGKYGATPEDSVQCVQCLSLYQEFMKQKAYTDALPHLRCATTVCPASSKKMYLDLAKVRKYQLAKEKDAATQSLLADSLYQAYDMRIASFGQRTYVLGRKGVDMLKYTPDRAQEIYATLKESVDGRKEKSEAGPLAAYYQVLYNLYQNGEATKEQMLEEYLRIMGYVEANMANTGGGEDGEDGEDAGTNYYELARNNINELFFQVADCADIGSIVGKLMGERPDDAELHERLLKVMNTKECTEEPSYLPLAEKVHKAKPSSESAYGLGLYLAKQRDMSGSLKYMKEAVDLCSDCTDRVKYLLKAGQVASAAGAHGQSRSFANQVLQVEPSNGEALILIGNAIAASASGCAEPEVWGPNWLAYDYYQRAKSLDPGVADKASERMAACAARFPEQAKAFFHQLSEGQSFQVTCGGWNESTTVRVRK